MKEEIDKLIGEYSTVPPPWVMYNEHPLSLCWRMGGGESHIVLWGKWWSQQNLTEDQKIAYFRKMPPPHCWLKFLIGAIWNIDTFKENKLTPYFNRTSELGFGTQKDYEQDYDDMKWLES